MQIAGIMTKSNTPFLFAASAILALPGCATAPDQFPSLAVREAERMSGTLTPAQPEPAAPTYSVPAGEVENALAMARGAHERFVAGQPATTRLINSASGLAMGTDTHSRALIALADLTTYHSETASALASLDRLEAQGAVLFAPIDAVKAAQAEVEAMIGQQDAALDQLARELDR